MSIIVINPIPTKDNTDDFLSPGFLTAHYPMMETHEHAKLYGLFKGVRVREIILNRSISGTFERSTVYPVPAGENVLVCIGCDDEWKGDEIPSVVAVVRSMSSDNKKVVIVSELSNINGAKELHDALEKEITLERLDITGLKQKVNQKEL